MGYSDLDEFDLQRNTQYNLPPRIAERFITSQQVISRVEAGEDPVDLSILKWQRLVEVLEYINQRTTREKYLHNFKGYIGYKSCALCVSSMKIYRKKHGQMEHKRQKCQYCPLEKVDCCLDAGSAYHQVDQVVQKFYDNSSQLQEEDYALFENNIRRMLANLQKIKAESLQARAATPAALKPAIQKPAARPEVKPEAANSTVKKQSAAVLPFSDSIAARFVTLNEIETRLARGESPAALTIEKWQRFADVVDFTSAQGQPGVYLQNFIAHIDLESSALCIQSQADYKKNYGEPRQKTDKCRVCPLARLDACHVGQSSYDRIKLLLERWQRKGVAPADARKQLTILRGLVANLLNHLKVVKQRVAPAAKEANESAAPADLPAEINKRLLTSRQVAHALAEKKDPVKLTLLKWQRLHEVLQYILTQKNPGRFIHNFKPAMGQFTSALCVASTDKFSSLYGAVTSRSDKCRVCPLARVERCIDQGAAYYQVDKSLHRFYEGQVHPSGQEIELQDLKKNIEKVIKNLQSL